MRPKLNTGAATLTTIAKHAVWLDCGCGRVAPTGYSLVYEGTVVDAMRGAAQGMPRREE